MSKKPAQLLFFFLIFLFAAPAFAQTVPPGYRILAAGAMTSPRCPNRLS